MSTALQSEDLAFESLYRLHRPPVYAYVLSTVRHAADAEDVTQTTFLNAYCALHRGVAPRDDLQWLLAIARNVCRDRFRDAKRRPKEEQLADWMRLVQPEEPDYSVREICKQISELSPRYRQILLLREFEGRSYAEISAQLGVSEQAAQTLLARARRALRDELELGMTCSHARRVALRQLNGVALRDERRALQRHLRKCADCATFVGRTPRTPIARMLWLVWLPYRRLMAIFAASTAPAGTTAGSGGALAMKLLAATAIGSTALGVTVTEVNDGTVPVRVKQAPARPAAVVASHHLGTPVRSAAVTTSWGSPRLVTGRAPLTHATHHATPWLPELSGSSPAASVARVPGTTDTHSVPAADPPAVTDQPEATVTPATPTDSAPVVDTGSAATSAAPALGTTGSPAADGSSAPSTDSTSSALAPTSPTPAADPASTPSTTPVVSPPVTTPTPPDQTGARGNGNSNGVGQDGTPPGQTNKPDPPAHGRP